ncbi:L-serine ammonia-lyase [Desulfopila sp. IMCC35008]|uniref:L-serine ammonia-lyase n=1 Tax=Desulfopila sp. IMCC35008 TaxID=2653858 RepID=UPI0013D16ACB|nr:L-serine ammonia-lyase [Desulfopila sp. IMCC35008]
MFISVLDLFKIGIGPSSSHTMGPMVAAAMFRELVVALVDEEGCDSILQIRCTLKGSLSYTGEGHATDKAILLGLHGYSPLDLVSRDIPGLVGRLLMEKSIKGYASVRFVAEHDIIFDRGPALPEHPNGMVFDAVDNTGRSVLSRTWFSVGGGFLSTPEEMALSTMTDRVEMNSFPFPFESSKSMLKMAEESTVSIAGMKRQNELKALSAKELDERLDELWFAMKSCLENGLQTKGVLAGGLGVERRAGRLLARLESSTCPDTNELLCAYAFAVSEENSSGHMVVTAPTNGAAGVIPAVLYYAVKHLGINREQVREFLLTAGAVGGLIKHRGSISGAEVGCQGEIGSASAMAAAGLCAIRGGTPRQVEHAAEMALEHHLGMTCDPVSGLVQVPCIERNGFGAVKAFTAASLALLEDGEHFISLDSCIAAMKQTGLEMSEKYKETSLGGLAANYIEC